MRPTCAAVTAIVDTSHGRWPVLLGLYWDGGEVPGAHALAALPYLSEVDLSAFDGDEPPDHMGVAFPHVMTVAVSRPGDTLRPEIGEVVARGVAREEDLGDTGSFTTTSWAREQEPAPIDAAAAFWLEHLRRESLDEG